MKLNKFTLALLLSGVTSALTGCTVGQSDFNCSAGDDNALCASSRTIYRATNDDLVENEEITYIKDGEVHQTSLSELNGLKRSLDDGEETGRGAILEKNSSVQHFNHSNNDVPFQFSFDGNVLRKDVEVLRIWIAPWTDKTDNLHLSTVIYTDIENRKWEIGTIEPESGLQTGVTPFLATSPTNANADTGAETTKARKANPSRN